MNVRSELGVPKLGIGFWGVSESTANVPVPKASVNEDNKSMLRKYNVRAAREIPPVEAEAIAGSMEH